MLETVRERQIETNNKTEIAMWLVYVYLVLPCGSLFYIYIYIYIYYPKKILFIYNYVIVSRSGCTGNPNAKPDN